MAALLQPSLAVEGGPSADLNCRSGGSLCFKTGYAGWQSNPASTLPTVQGSGRASNPPRPSPCVQSCSTATQQDLEDIWPLVCSHRCSQARIAAPHRGLIPPLVQQRPRTDSWPASHDTVRCGTGGTSRRRRRHRMAAPAARRSPDQPPYSHQHQQHTQVLLTKDEPSTATS